MSNQGIHKDGNGYYIATLRKKNKKNVIDKLEFSSHAPQAQGIKTTGLPSSDILIRTFEMPLSNKRALMAALPFQIENHIPHPIDQLLMHTHLRPIDSQATSLEVIACHHDKLEKHLESNTSQWVSCYPMALFRTARHFFPKIESAIIAHMGQTETLLIAYDQNQLISSTSFPIGKDTFLHAWKTKNPGKNLPNDLSQIFQEQNGPLQELKTYYFKQLDRSIYYLKSKCKTALHLYGVPLGFHPEFFGHDLLDLPTTESTISNDQAPYAIAIGLALDTALNDEKTVQFLQGSFTPPYFLAKLGKKLCASFFLASCIALLTLFVTSKKLREKETLLERDIHAYVEELGKHHKLSLQDFIAPEGLPADQRLNYKIDKLKTLSRKQGGFLPMHQPLPTTSEVLYCLANHPVLQSAKLSSFDYQLETYPTLENPRTPYAGKITCLLHVPSSSDAKKIHDALLADDQIIDTDQELEWTRTSDGYHLSFYLRRVR